MLPNSVFVIIACYNEASAIATTIARLKLIAQSVIVVDDASTDNSADVASRAGAQVVGHPINLGQGAALQTGIELALQRGAEYLVTFDADGQHDAAEIPGMLEALLSSDADIVLGSRFLGGAQGLPKSRRLVLKAAILFTRLTSGGSFTDVHNGFRIMTRRFAESFEFRQNRMAHASEILNHIVHEKVKFIEHPVTISYTEYTLSKGQRNINSVRIIMELLLGKISK